LGADFADGEAERLWHEHEASRDGVLDAHGLTREAFWSTFHEIEDPAARAEATYVYDDAAAVVPALERPVGLVTHCQPYLTEPILEHLDIADWFDTVVCGGDDVGWKPDPGPLETAMADMGVAGGRGVMAGDAPADVGAANNAGLDAVHVARHPESNGSAGATHRVSTLRALQK
jgi:phosphoglycolate phosphatase